ncbi:ABC transporter substrate-binding protein [Aureimonas mangrovi]|uniref:ABC transporter substrate-binding protein n=1 Tax=Aureimonas mangrovi TaxID=2758041 RepID=UPI00163D98A0
MQHRILMASTGLAALAFALPAAAQTTLTIESWRSDDIATWQETIIPAFEAAHPDISINFSPTAPTEYNSALGAKLDAGTAGDLIACRPFDASLALFERGQLADLSDLEGMDNFSAVARTAWATDDGSQTFCVPMASVLHGFMYNETAFEELGITPPTTEEEFFAALDTIQEDGTYIPMAMGTLEQWEAATMGYQNIGPAYWRGEEGREALIAGTEKLTDPEWVRPFEALARWRDYLGDGFEAQSYADSQNLFTLGRAAIYPAGSWEIAIFESQADFPIKAFAPPVVEAGGTCYVSDHPDIGMGLNAASPNAEAARTFLAWVASPEFAALYANAAPGFFPLIDQPVELENELAREIVAWRESCEPTIRSTYQILSRGTPNLENETWTASANVVNGTETPQAAAERLQQGLDSWYTPGSAPNAADAAQ